MVAKVVHILARDIEAAKNIARKAKNLNIGTARWVEAGKHIEGRLKTYSFRIKEY